MLNYSYTALNDRLARGYNSPHRSAHGAALLEGERGELVSGQEPVTVDVEVPESSLEVSVEAV